MSTVAQLPSVTIIVPTYKEVESLPRLIDALGDVRKEHQLEMNVLVMDDNSQDGTEAMMSERPEDWVKLVIRTEDRGLSPAVLEGMRMATGDHIITMDADLSHPPTAIPKMMAALVNGADFALGSRYIDGGTTSHDWGFLRYINSRVATWLARPFTSVKDPMSGFFGVSRATFEAGSNFEPIGYKIGLEVLVKCNCTKAVEIPIHFEDRQFGESKLTLSEQLRYIRHLRRLMNHKYGSWSHLLQFLTVGAIGTVVNLGFLTVFLAMAMPQKPAIGLAIAISVFSNFILNRTFSFSYAKHGPIVRQFVGFVIASLAGILVQYFLTVWFGDAFPQYPIQAGAILGITAASFLNFMTNRFLVFKHTHVRAKN